MTDPPDAHRAYAPKTLGYALLTLSDSRTTAEDTSGHRARELITGAGHRVVAAQVLPDDTTAIRAALRELLGRDDVDVVVAMGGTGLAPRDLTIEAIEPLLERTLPGFGELFRMLSHRQVGAAAMLSRATAGIAAGRAVFALPGSPNAVELALTELVLPEAAHLLGQARRS